ncbi:uncharacterized protein LOC143684028 isoform X1 [Tamandua tetradactyla]|uniref:uncharacterized protein LOC143684028 isoform X1 n=1 Tax=Tamandua tetradactyla TaxID=48850 RepID=UPI0040538F7A
MACSSYPTVHIQLVVPTATLQRGPLFAAGKEALSAGLYTWEIYNCCSRAPLENLAEEAPSDKKDLEAPSNAEVTSRSSEKTLQEQLMVAAGQEHEEIPHNDKHLRARWRSLLVTGQSRRLHLIPRWTQKQAKMVAPRVSTNDVCVPKVWLADQWYDSTSSEEDNNAGHPITVTALIHSEPFFMDSEDSDIENDNLHQSSLFEEEESQFLNSRLLERNQDVKEEKRGREMKISTTEALTGMATIEHEHGGGDKNWTIRASTDPPTENCKDGELETST